MQAALWKLDPRSGRRLGSFAIGRSGPDFGAVTSSGGAIWAAAGNHILRLDPAGVGRTQRASLPGEAAGVAVGFGSVWVTTIGASGDSLVRLDAKTLARQAIVHLDAQPMALVSGLGSLWLALSYAVDRVDPRTNDLVPTAVGASGTTALAVSGDHLWLLQRSAVALIDRHGRQSERIQLPFPAGSFAVGRHQLWITNNCGCRKGLLAVIDRKTLRARTLAIGVTPVALTTTPSATWAATFGDARLWRVATRR